MENQISILFDVYHLYHLAQFDPLIDLLEMTIDLNYFFLHLVKIEKRKLKFAHQF